MPILFNFAINPKAIVKNFIYEKVHVFSSKKAPIKLVCHNA